MLLVLLATTMMSAQSSTRSGEVVAGTVANAINGRQIPRALVLLKNLDPTGSSVWTRADDSGRFVLMGVEPGSYIISAEQQGFFTDRRTAARLALVEVPLREAAGNFTIPLTPFSLVSGQVLDVHSDPVPGAEVRLLGWEYVNGLRRLAVKARGVTDDRGEYRVASVMPGRYFVMAHISLRTNWERFFAVAGQAPHPDLAYMPLFYPDTTDFREAQRLNARPGNEETVDFLFAPVHAVSIRGRVVSGLSGKPVAGAPVTVSWAEFAGAIEPVITKADADGNYEVWGLAPGSYRLTTTFPEDGETCSGEEQVEVGRSGATAVQIAGLPSFEVVGHVRVDDQPEAKAQGIRVEFMANNGRGSVAFAVQGKPGELGFTGKLQPQTSYRVRMLRLPDDYYLESVLVAGREVAPENVTISAKKTEIELVINSTGGHVDGTVMDEKNQPINGSLVLMAPDSQDALPQAFLQTRSDAKGKFTFRGVPPGVYKFMAWEGVEFDQLMAQPEILQDAVSQAQSLTVEKSGTYTVFPKPLPADLLP